MPLDGHFDQLGIRVRIFQVQDFDLGAHDLRLSAAGESKGDRPDYPENMLDCLRIT
jgi:hypothetical protein